MWEYIISIFDVSVYYQKIYSFTQGMDPYTRQDSFIIQNADVLFEIEKILLFHNAHWLTFK